MARDTVLVARQGVGLRPRPRRKRVLRCIMDDDHGVAIGVMCSGMENRAKRQPDRERHERTRHEGTPTAEQAPNHSVVQASLAS